MKTVITKQKIIFSVLAALTLGSGSAIAQQPDSVVALKNYEQQIGYQKRLVYEEKAALDQAIRTRNNQVNISKDVLDTVAYGVSSGALTWDFLKGTDNLAQVRSYFVSRNVGALAPRDPATSTTASSVSSEETGAAAAAGSKEAALAKSARIAKGVSVAAYRTTEIVSAAVLGVFMVGQLYKTGNDVSIRFSDTNEIREHRAKLNEAQKNLDVADQNLQVAILAQQM